MKRLHIHIAVNDLATSTRFYTTLFNSEPTVHKDDYAKWMLDDPRVNFSISDRGRAAGLDHLGIQVEDDAELAATSAQLQQADVPLFDQGETTCCYTHSQKVWTHDPQGVAWETFLTRGESTTFGYETVTENTQESCCAPPAAPVEFIEPKAVCTPTSNYC